MRIHTDHISRLEVAKALSIAGVRFTRFDTHGSRKRDHAYDLILTGSSPRSQNGGGEKAATWDEWGVVLAVLFAVDAAAIAGHYQDAEHFHWCTGGRFRSPLAVADTFERGHTHRWTYSGDSVTGSYSVHECRCGAVQRYLSGFKTWAAFVAANA